MNTERLTKSERMKKIETVAIHIGSPENVCINIRLILSIAEYKEFLHLLLLSFILVYSTHIFFFAYARNRGCVLYTDIF